MLPPAFVEEMRQIVGADRVRADPAALDAYGQDALKRGSTRPTWS